MAEQDKFIINVAKILAPVVGSRDLMPILSEAVNKADVKSVDLDFQKLNLFLVRQPYALLLMKEDLQRKWLNKIHYFVNTSDNVQEMFRVVAATGRCPKRTNKILKLKNQH